MMESFNRIGYSDAEVFNPDYNDEKRAEKLLQAQKEAFAEHGKSVGGMDDKYFGLSPTDPKYIEQAIARSEASSSAVRSRYRELTAKLSENDIKKFSGENISFVKPVYIGDLDNLNKLTNLIHPSNPDYQSDVITLDTENNPTNNTPSLISISHKSGTYVIDWAKLKGEPDFRTHIEKILSEHQTFYHNFEFDAGRLAKDGIRVPYTKNVAGPDGKVQKELIAHDTIDLISQLRSGGMLKSFVSNNKLETLVKSLAGKVTLKRVHQALGYNYLEQSMINTGDLHQQYINYSGQDAAAHYAAVTAVYNDKGVVDKSTSGLSGEQVDKLRKLDVIGLIKSHINKAPPTWEEVTKNVSVNATRTEVIPDPMHPGHTIETVGSYLDKNRGISGKLKVLMDSKTKEEFYKHAREYGLSIPQMAIDAVSKARSFYPGIGAGLQTRGMYYAFRDAYREMHEQYPGKYPEFSINKAKPRDPAIIAATGSERYKDEKLEGTISGKLFTVKPVEKDGVKLYDKLIGPRDLRIPIGYPEAFMKIFQKSAYSIPEVTMKQLGYWTGGDESREGMIGGLNRVFGELTGKRNLQNVENYFSNVIDTDSTGKEYRIENYVRSNPEQWMRDYRRALISTHATLSNMARSMYIKPVKSRKRLFSQAIGLETESGQRPIGNVQYKKFGEKVQSHDYLRNSTIESLYGLQIPTESIPGVSPGQMLSQVYQLKKEGRIAQILPYRQLHPMLDMVPGLERFRAIQENAKLKFNAPTEEMDEKFKMLNVLHDSLSDVSEHDLKRYTHIGGRYKNKDVERSNIIRLMKQGHSEAEAKAIVESGGERLQQALLAKVLYPEGSDWWNLGRNIVDDPLRKHFTDMYNNRANYSDDVQKNLLNFLDKDESGNVKFDANGYVSFGSSDQRMIGSAQETPLSLGYYHGTTSSMEAGYIAPKRFEFDIVNQNFPKYAKQIYAGTEGGHAQYLKDAYNYATSMKLLSRLPTKESAGVAAGSIVDVVKGEDQHRKKYGVSALQDGEVLRLNKVMNDLMVHRVAKDAILHKVAMEREISNVGNLPHESGAYGSLSYKNVWNETLGQLFRTPEVSVVDKNVGSIQKAKDLRSQYSQKLQDLQLVFKKEKDIAAYYKFIESIENNVTPQPYTTPGMFDRIMNFARKIGFGSGGLQNASEYTLDDLANVEQGKSTAFDYLDGLKNILYTNSDVPPSDKFAADGGEYDVPPYLNVRPFVSGASGEKSSLFNLGIDDNQKPIDFLGLSNFESITEMYGSGLFGKDRYNLYSNNPANGLFVPETKKVVDPTTGAIRYDTVESDNLKTFDVDASRVSWLQSVGVAGRNVQIGGRDWNDISWHTFRALAGNAGVAGAEGLEEEAKIKREKLTLQRNAHLNDVKSRAMLFGYKKRENLKDLVGTHTDYKDGSNEDDRKETLLGKVTYNKRTDMIFDPVTGGLKRHLIDRFGRRSAWGVNPGKRGRVLNRDAQDYRMVDKAAYAVHQRELNEIVSGPLDSYGVEGNLDRIKGSVIDNEHGILKRYLNLWGPHKGGQVDTDQSWKNPTEERPEYDINRGIDQNTGLPIGSQNPVKVRPAPEHDYNAFGLDFTWMKTNASDTSFVENTHLFDAVKQALLIDPNREDILKNMELSVSGYWNKKNRLEGWTNPAEYVGLKPADRNITGRLGTSLFTWLSEGHKDDVKSGYFSLLNDTNLKANNRKLFDEYGQSHSILSKLMDTRNLHLSKGVPKLKAIESTIESVIGDPKYNRLLELVQSYRGPKPAQNDMGLGRPYLPGDWDNDVTMEQAEQLLAMKSMPNNYLDRYLSAKQNVKMWEIARGNTYPDRVSPKPSRSQLVDNLYFDYGYQIGHGGHVPSFVPNWLQATYEKLNVGMGRLPHHLKNAASVMSVTRPWGNLGNTTDNPLHTNAWTAVRSINETTRNIALAKLSRMGQQNVKEYMEQNTRPQLDSSWDKRYEDTYYRIKESPVNFDNIGMGDWSSKIGIDPYIANVGMLPYQEVSTGSNYPFFTGQPTGVPDVGLQSDKNHNENVTERSLWLAEDLYNGRLNQGQAEFGNLSKESNYYARYGIGLTEKELDWDTRKRNLLNTDFTGPFGFMRKLGPLATIPRYAAGTPNVRGGIILGGNRDRGIEATKEYLKPFINKDGQIQFFRNAGTHDPSTIPDNLPGGFKSDDSHEMARGRWVGPDLNDLIGFSKVEMIMGKKLHGMGGKSRGSIFSTYVDVSTPEKLEEVAKWRAERKHMTGFVAPSDVAKSLQWYGTLGAPIDGWMNGTTTGGTANGPSIVGEQAGNNELVLQPGLPPQLITQPTLMNLRNATILPNVNKIPQYSRGVFGKDDVIDRLLENGIIDPKVIAEHNRLLNDTNFGSANTPSEMSAASGWSGLLTSSARVNPNDITGSGLSGLLFGRRTRRIASRDPTILGMYQNPSYKYLESIQGMINSASGTFGEIANPVLPAGATKQQQLEYKKGMADVAVHNQSINMSGMFAQRAGAVSSSMGMRETDANAYIGNVYKDQLGGVGNLVGSMEGTPLDSASDAKKKAFNATMTDKVSPGDFTLFSDAIKEFANAAKSMGVHVDDLGQFADLIDSNVKSGNTFLPKDLVPQFNLLSNNLKSMNPELRIFGDTAKINSKFNAAVVSPQFQQSLLMKGYSTDSLVGGLKYGLAKRSDPNLSPEMFNANSYFSDQSQGWDSKLANALKKRSMKGEEETITFTYGAQFAKTKDAQNELTRIESSMGSLAENLRKIDPNLKYTPTAGEKFSGILDVDAKGDTKKGDVLNKVQHGFSFTIGRDQLESLYGKGNANQFIEEAKGIIGPRALKENAGFVTDIGGSVQTGVRSTRPTEENSGALQASSVIQGYGRRMTALSMGAMGTYFSVTGLYASIERGIAMVTDSLKDLSTSMKSIALADAFGNNIIKAKDVMDTLGVKTEDFVSGWKRITSLQSIYQVFLGSIGASMTKTADGSKSAFDKISESLMGVFTDKAVVNRLASSISDLAVAGVKLIPTFMQVASVFATLAGWMAKYETVGKIVVVFTALAFIMQPVITIFAVFLELIAAGLMLFAYWAPAVKTAALASSQLAAGTGLATGSVIGMNGALGMTITIIGSLLPVILGLAAAYGVLSLTMGEVSNSGFLGGALLGAGIGSIVAPGVGTGVGAVLGASIGGMFGPKGHSRGGLIADGDDTIISAKTGEYVVNERATRSNLKLLESINRGYSNGGMIGIGPSISGAADMATQSADRSAWSNTMVPMGAATISTEKNTGIFSSIMSAVSGSSWLNVKVLGDESGVKGKGDELTSGPSLNPLDWIGGIVDAGSNFISDFGKGIDQVSLPNAVGAGAGGAVTGPWIPDIGKWIGDWFKGIVWPDVGKWFSDWWDGIKWPDFVKNISDWINGIKWPDISGTIKNWLGLDTKLSWSEIISEKLTGIKEAIIEIFTGEERLGKTKTGFQEVGNKESELFEYNKRSGVTRESDSNKRSIDWFKPAEDNTNVKPKTALDLVSDQSEYQLNTKSEPASKIGKGQTETPIDWFTDGRVVTDQPGNGLRSAGVFKSTPPSGRVGEAVTGAKWGGPIAGVLESFNQLFVQKKSVGEALPSIGVATGAGIGLGALAGAFPILGAPMSLLGHDYMTQVPANIIGTATGGKYNEQTGRVDGGSKIGKDVTGMIGSTVNDVAGFAATGAVLGGPVGALVGGGVGLIAGQVLDGFRMLKEAQESGGTKAIEGQYGIGGSMAAWMYNLMGSSTGRFTSDQPVNNASGQLIPGLPTVGAVSAADVPAGGYVWGSAADKNQGVGTDVNGPIKSFIDVITNNTPGLSTGLTSFVSTLVTGTPVLGLALTTFGPMVFDTLKAGLLTGMEILKNFGSWMLETAKSMLLGVANVGGAVGTAVNNGMAGVGQLVNGVSNLFTGGPSTASTILNNSSSSSGETKSNTTSQPITVTVPITVQGNVTEDVMKNLESRISDVVKSVLPSELKKFDYKSNSI